MKKIKTSTLKKVVACIGKYKSTLIISLILSVFCVGASLYIPVLAGNAIDSITGKGNVDFEKLKTNLFGIAVLAVLSAAIQWIINTLNNKMSFNVVKDIRNKAVAKISVLPISYIDSHPTGDTVSRIISDADQLADGLLMGFTQLFTGILTILGTLVFMLKISPKITPVVVLLTPLSLLVAKYVAGHTHSMFMKQSEARGKQTAQMDETVTNRKVISAYAAEERVSGDFEEINEEFAKYSLKAIFYSSLTNPSTRFVNNIIYACVALAGALCAVGGSITIGGLSCFLSYAGQYAKPFNEISGVIAELQNAAACAERLFELIEAEPETPEKENALVLNNAKGNIRLENVAFSYDKSRELIKDLNLDVHEGSRIAIVGPTGCGKTTVINLLMRFYDTDSGRITVENTDIRDITRHSLRSNYGMVLQETWIKTGTVFENIRLADPGASDERVIEAAKAAHAHSFIKRLPDGYNTVISDSSTLLSQGQKQLLCIARVMLIKPPVLILDEATSSIDTRTEIKIRKAFAKITEGKTSFIVAHRLSTVRNSDVILVMNDGKIIEQGSHTELMKKHGFYEKLYNSRIC